MYLSDFENELSPTPVPQSEGLEWLAHQHALRSSIDEHKLLKMLNRFGCSPGQISQRRTWLPDFFDKTQAPFFRNPVDREQPTMEERLALFQKQMGIAVRSLYNRKTHAVDHLLHVTCTGYASPSVAQELVLEKQWLTTVQHLYHMGCYAAIPAIRTANGLIQSAEAESVDILHTEFCTLHMNLQSTTPEQLVVQSLFADACIRYRASKNRPEHNPSFKLCATHEVLIPDSRLDMSWELANFGFSMTLSREVPTKIGQHLRPFLQTLFQKANLPLAEISKLSVALHPGGPKVIDAVKAILEFREEQVAISRKVLFENGNMSSATVPFIWKALLEEGAPRRSPYVLSLAFGPGLTIAGSLLCSQS